MKSIVIQNKQTKHNIHRTNRVQDEKLAYQLYELDASENESTHNAEADTSGIDIS